VANHVNGNFYSEVGWPDMVERVARIAIPCQPKKGDASLYWQTMKAEAGAINLYGPPYGLPMAISGMNSNWYRGYDDPAPQTVITLGERRDFLQKNFDSCVLARRVSNRYGIVNSAVGWDEIFVCRRLRWSWPPFWKHFQYYG